MPGDRSGDAVGKVDLGPESEFRLRLGERAILDRIHEWTPIYAADQGLRAVQHAAQMPGQLLGWHEAGAPDVEHLVTGAVPVNDEPVCGFGNVVHVAPWPLGAAVDLDRGHRVGGDG